MPRKPETVSETLRRAIIDSGESLMDIERATGVDSGRLSRFMRAERGLTLSAVDKLARHLGLRLVIQEGRSK